MAKAMRRRSMKKRAAKRFFTIIWNFLSNQVAEKSICMSQFLWVNIYLPQKNLSQNYKGTPKEDLWEEGRESASSVKNWWFLLVKESRPRVDWKHPISAKTSKEKLFPRRSPPGERNLVGCKPLSRPERLWASRDSNYVEVKPPKVKPFTERPNPSTKSKRLCLQDSHPTHSTEWIIV